jgi:UDP-N-acetylmuramate dehydrogenase
MKSLPLVRGKLIEGALLAPFTWFRVGGKADWLFLPADSDDLQYFLQNIDSSLPITVLGVGSNVIVRDGGIEGVVIRLMGKAFSTIEIADDQIVAGAGALDSLVAKASAKAGIAGLEFFAGIPGTIGGALTMNAGCYGRETKDVLIEAKAIDLKGNFHSFSNADFGFSYRRNAIEEPLIWLEARFQGVFDSEAEVTERIEAITKRRETTQPIREKTGGSTFKNPEGKSAWQCVDEAGWRGKLWGGAMFSPLHANFMINAENASASDLEALGEAVRIDVLKGQGIDLQWEIKRIGRS